ncbi:hypothetical protein BOTBODRAFT_36393 [Botryobasidium botryosum FD-172 SS1]|uniref:N-acetylglucosaminylphosphatidylinositol deacetylase n=1 Tax=Botryobasidium botryosum (strain FD-172 SS1) TaxID=930990 RepID=A0A067M3F0_BOTB1|nr:hypothetical protein BOTBODRAFT_36393 [Botryobasidium botryosum FD-172 SS1]
MPRLFRFSIFRLSVLYVVAWISFQLLSAQTSQPSLPPSNNILILTSHPDDEAMFFAPTILSLAKHKDLTVWALVLSVGNADGLGDTRRREVEESYGVLGVRLDRVAVMDHPQLQDDITRAWDASVIAELIRPYVEKHDIDTILTFDSFGVSRHPNHISLPLGVSHLLCDPTLQRPAPALYSLRTTSLVQKYTGMASLIFPSPRTAGGFKVVSGVRQYVQALKAMMKHWSQLVWFRWLYIAFSRYMWINEWDRVTELAC